MNSHRLFKALLIGVCVSLLLTACDKREYNSTTVLASEGGNGALRDEAGSADSSGASGSSSLSETGDTNAGNTSAGGTSAGNAFAEADPIVVSSSEALSDTLVGEDVVDAIGTSNPADANSTDANTTDANSADANSADANAADANSADANTADAAGAITTGTETSDSDSEAVDAVNGNPSEAGDTAGGIGESVPEGPDIDRVGLGSVFQPFADEETATFTIDGRASLSLAAVGGPVLTSPRAVMEEIDVYVLNNVNQAAFSGRFSEAGEFSYGVWAGDVSNLSQIFVTGTAIPGLPEGHTYFRTRELAMDDRGVMSQLAAVQAESLIDAYIVSQGNSHSVLMQSDSSQTGLIGPVDIDFIETMSQANNAHALVSRARMVGSEQVEPVAGVTQAEDSEPQFIDVVSNQYSVWYLVDGRTRPVVHSWMDATQRAPRLSNGCGIYAPGNKVDNSRLGMTRDRILIFQAQLGGRDDCEDSRAVMRFDGSSYQEVVKDGDSVPGSATHIFNDVSLYSLTDDGSAIVFANLTTEADRQAAEQAEAAEAEPGASLLSAEVEDIDRGQWSFWLMPQQGGSRLLALEGEEIQIGRTVTVLSGEPRYLALETNASNLVALKLLLEDAENPVFFVGSGHAGQPHASIETPGASALSYAFTGNSALPGQSDDVVLASLGTPYLDDSGNLILYGEVELSEEAEEATADAALAGENPEFTLDPYNSIWQIDASGAIRELVRSGDEISVAGVNKELASLSVSGQIARASTSGIRLNSSGAMLLRASIERKFGNSVLLYISP